MGRDDSRGSAAGGTLEETDEDEREPAESVVDGWALIRLGPLLLLVGFVCGCSTNEDSGTIQLLVDDEAGTFTRSPAPTALQVVAFESADASTVLSTTALPATTIDLGRVTEGTSAVSLEVRGIDDAGTLRVFGASLAFTYAGLAGSTLPVFVQRTGEFARLPGPLADARTAPALAVLQGQTLVVGGGNEAATALTTNLFDFGGVALLASPPTLPAVPQSMATYGTIAWLLGASGGTYFDFSSSGLLAIPQPAGGTFADVAGGQTVTDSSGVEYVVGATRATGSPTATILKIDPGDATDPKYPYGRPTWLTLAVPRVGAAAAWVDGQGLVVAGGLGADAAADANMPIEIVAPGTTLGVVRTYAATPFTGVFGGGAAALDAQTVLLAGGISATTLQDPGVRAVALGCVPSATASCVTPWSTLPLALASAQTFSWSPTDALVVGNQAGTGATHVYRLTPTTTTEVRTRVPHKNARATWSPVGSIVLAGGSTSLESFTP